MDKQANKDLRDLSKVISQDIADEFRNSARGSRWYPEQASFVAQSARATRDRVPSVTVGGSKAYSTSDGRRVAAGSLLFLSEFGSPEQAQRDRFRNSAQRRTGARGGLQGPPRSPREGRGNRGWWLFPALSVYSRTSCAAGLTARRRSLTSGGSSNGISNLTDPETVPPG
jgi:hypothetical protein